MNISEEIKNQRLKNNLTQEQLSEKIFVSKKKTISNWKTGRTYPDLETIVAISDLFNILLDELLKRDKN